MSRLVEIVPLGFADQGLLSALCAEIGRIFPMRGQYHATRILEHLVASDRNSFRLLGVTAVDLFTPIMRYVFGEAMLQGRAALVSMYRLGIVSPQGDHPGDRSIFVGRVFKEGIHELGHTFGLTHCKDPTCVMSASLDMTRIDAKSTRLCYYCRVMLEDELGGI